MKNKVLNIYPIIFFLKTKLSEKNKFIIKNKAKIERPIDRKYN